jgi:hypothetical protein
MDLNQKYFEYQRAILDASLAPDAAMREFHLERAVEIAGQIELFQSQLGAAASCAWSTSKQGIAVRAVPGPNGQDL